MKRKLPIGKPKKKAMMEVNKPAQPSNVLYVDLWKDLKEENKATLKHLFHRH